MAFGRLGGSFSGVEPESLLGLMECLCVVCSAPVSGRKQEDLVAATRWLLQEREGHGKGSWEVNMRIYIYDI